MTRLKKLAVRDAKRLRAALPEGHRPTTLFIVKGEAAGLQLRGWALGDNAVIGEVEDRAGLWMVPREHVRRP